MQIANLQNAIEYSIGFHQHPTLVVGENGDVHANCNVDAVCDQHEMQGEKYFIVKGQRTPKAVIKPTKPTEE